MIPRDTVLTIGMLHDILQSGTGNDIFSKIENAVEPRFEFKDGLVYTIEIDGVQTQAIYDNGTIMDLNGTTLVSDIYDDNSSVGTDDIVSTDGVVGIDFPDPNDPGNGPSYFPAPDPFPNKWSDYQASWPNNFPAPILISDSWNYSIDPFIEVAGTSLSNKDKKDLVKNWPATYPITGVTPTGNPFIYYVETVLGLQFSDANIPNYLDGVFE